MSKEVNENGKPFVLSSKGLTNFGEVTADSGLPAAPIKLSIGENTKDVKGKNHGYGLLHIEASHGTQIRKAGFHSIEEFVENVAENYDTIREGSLIGKKQTYLLEVSDEHNNTLFVQLSRDGQYWNVNSAGIFREAYSRRKPKVASLPTIGSNPSTETAEVNRDHSMDAVATSGNSSTTSADKVTESSEELQEQEEKFSPTPSGNTGSEARERDVRPQVDNEPTAAAEQPSAERGQSKSNTLSQENTEPRQIKLSDPRTMSDEEKQRRGEMLRDAYAIEVTVGQIVATEEVSARRAAEKWWDENVSEPAFYDTEAGEVEINRNSVESSLAHRYGQMKLDAITSLIDGFENAVYLGTMPDSRERGVVDHYFAYPIMYNGERCYVFCRAMQDANKNRLYVHEVFVAERIKKGDTLQTAASKPHGGISLYRDILANVLDASKEEVRSASEEQNEQSATDNTLRAEDKSDNPTTPNGNVSNSSAGKVTESSEELQGKEDKFTPVPIEDGEDYVDYAARVAAVKAQHDAIKAAENATDTNPTDGQKKAGNYKKGHVQIGAFDISVEQPKGSMRRGKDADGKEWESKMNNTYGYFRGTEGVDGDHIDVFLSNDIDGWNGRKVFVVDQYNPDGTFDEHKVMLGFNDADDAKSNYLANYEKGWENGRRIEVSTTNLEDFEKWISSSHRKTKPFAEYKGVKIDEVQSASVKYQPIIRATFNKVKREQGIIEPIAEKKRKPFTVFDVTVKEPRRPMFGGVYHDGGMAVATNGLVMFAHKEAYDKAKEGKIITSKGDVIEGKFPDWRGAIPKKTIPTGLQTEPLLEFVNGALARMKAEKAKKYEVDGALAYIKFQDGNVVCCQLADLQKMLRAAKSIGADDLRLGTDKEFLVAESPAGKAIVIIQGEEKARYNAGYNNFSYEAPTVKGKEEVSDGALDNPYPSEKEVEQESKDDNTGNVVLKQFSNVLLSADTESQRLATDAALEGLKRAGVPVEVVSDEQAAVMLGEQKGVELSAKQKRALETASPAMQDHHTVVSSADGTKVLKDLDNTIEEYEKLKGNKPNTLIGDIAKVLGATRHGSNSEYASFETKNGKLVTIRLANHNAKVSTFDNNGESEGLSIVITPKENAKLTNDGEAHITEFYYNAVKLRRAEGKPLVEILKSIKQALYSGEYKDTTGLAEVQEVNVPRAELHMVYHGSGADFDAFDHSHMGEGEGQQAYGWGTYVTEVEGIGEQYAEANHGNLDFDEEAFYDEANEYIEEVFGSRDGLDYAYNDGGFEIFNVNRDPETLNYFLDYFKEHPNEFDSWEDPNEIDVSTLDEKGIEELGRALERSMDDVVQEDVQALFEKYMTVPARHLYSVEIPDDTGSNYLDYTKNYADDRSGINTDHLIDALYDEILATDDEHLYDSKQAKKELRKELSELAFSFGKDIYGDISSYLGSDKKASEFLHRQGVVGISYPAQYRSGGREDDARNYVIFDEEDLKITDHVQFMKTPSGTLYGWTVGGKIYLTKDGLNPNTPIHEYTHLWARAMKERNKEGWQSVKELLRDTPVWDEVLKDKNYQDILDDEDAIASEALSRISGQKNAEKMEAEARKMIDEAKDYVDKAKAISLLERMKSALKKFWNWVGKDLFGIKKFSSVDEITDRVLYDLVNKTKLTEEDKEEIAKRDKLYLEAVERGDMETAQRMVNEAAAQNGYFPNSEYQGTSAYNGKAPYGNGYFLTKEERKEAYENDEFDDDTSLDDYVNSGIDPKNLGDLTNDSSYRHADDARKEAIENLRDVFQNKRQTITMYRSVPSSVKEGSFRNGDWVTPSYAYAVENARIHGWGNKFRVIKQDVPISEVWFDGNDIAEFGYGNEDDFINDKDYLYNNTKNNRKLPDAVTYDDKGKVIPLSKRFNKRKGDPRFQIVDNSQTEEERQIIETAKDGGTYMKAPNGKPTRLTEKQWAQVRTKAFKSWFGDWEKAARIEKLRKSEPVVITGEEYKGKYELNRDSAKAWIKDNLRGEYTIADTGEKIAIGRKGINKVTSHSMGNEAHLKSLIAVPKMLEQSVFITEEKADKLNAQYPTYRYYVVGLNIAGVDYTAKLTIGVDENGNKYYDHALTEIEKGKLLDQINGQAVDNGFMSTGAEPNPSVTDSKDTKLVSILQTNSSKFVDENGEPMVFYHNTNNNFSVFDSERNGTHTDAGWLGDGFYFYGDENEGSGYGNIKMGVFLNVRDPYYATSEENNQLAEANSRDMSVDFRENLEEEGYDGVFYNGDLRQEAVVFESNQIKSATDNNGEFSQESDDIRYRESNGSSERTLVGIHNISADKLSKAIKQGGLANPSVAVIDISKQQHTGYGEISLIMPSDKINKRTGKNAGTFEGDAWTPMYPSVERQMSREGSLVMEHDIKALPNEMQLGVRNALRNWLDNRVDTKLSYLYLFQQGKAPDFETIKPKYNKEVHRAFGDIMHEVTNVYDLSKNDIEKLVDLYVKTELNGDFDEFNQSYERNIAKHKEILSNKKPGSLRYEKALIYLRDAEEYGRPIDVLQRFVDEVWRDKNTQGRVSIEKTFDAANKKIKEDGLENDYKKWTDGLNERYQTKEVIFDGFTPSGMRRYVPNTLENVSKLMKKQGRNASNGIGSSFSNFAASVMKANTSLDSIRKKKGKLTNDHQDLDDFEEKWQDVYVDLSRKLQPDANAYDDYGFARLQEAASKADPQAYLQKEYGVTLSDEDTQRLKDMVKAIKEERPSMYFETKFERPVTFDEFAAAVVPHNTDAEIKQQLRDAGLKVVEYEAGNEESRAKAVEEASKSDDIRFRQEERAARELAEVNERFNEELQKQIDGTLPAGHVYQLGMPGEILLSTGIPNLPIQMNAKRLQAKATSYGHDFDLSEVKDLVNVLQHPLALFSYGDKTKAQNIIVSLQKDGNNFIVGLSLNPSVGGHKLEINSIRNVFPKKNAEWLNWISQGKALYIDKEKVQNLIDQQRTILADVDYLDLDSVANILKDFENPTIDGKNHSALSENALSSEPSHDREAMRNEAVQLSDKLHTPIKIVEDVKDITHSNAEVERRKRNSKGWYDVRTGEVVVVLPNNRDVEDVAATVMHETVAHKGLRELVGEEHYDDFLDEVYKHLRGDLKQRVDAEAGRSFVDDTIKNGEKAKSYEQHRRTAVDELFGDMAEKPFEEFSEGERTLWQKLKEVVRKLLDKFLESLKLPKWFELGDNELRYMLWRSKERLERGKEHPIDFARDMVMREELGLSEAARMRMGDTPETFKARQRRAVKEKGVVMPGLNDAEVKVVDVPRHQYKNRNILDQARDAAIERYNKQVGTNEDGTPKWEAIPQEYNNYGISFFYEITPKALKSLVQHHTKSDNVGVHTAVLDKLHEVINGSIEYEEDPDVPKINGIRDISKGVNENVLIHRFIGTVRVEGKTYRVISKIKEYRETHINARPSTYQVTEIGVFDDETPNTPNGSKRANGYVHVAKLLKDVEKSYDSGKKVLDESRKADENPILYRDGEETEDIWKDKSMGLHERTTAAAMRLADKHQENKTLRNDAMRAIGNNLADLRKAMSLQRRFDMATVKRVSDLARVLMNNGYIGDMTQQEVKSLLAAVRNSVGHNDIDRDVQKVMEIMVKNQLRRAEKALSALEAIKGSKVNAKGVKVQGKLDAAGGQLMEVFKNIIEPIVNNHTLM